MTKPQTSPDHITGLKPGEVFVFGSNMAGRHGKGAAVIARNCFGAKWGRGEGHFGQSYAIPTKDEDIRKLPLSRIQPGVQRFITYARQNPHLTFLVTEIGCGLAGYHPKQIAPMFVEALALPNIHLPQQFVKVLKES